MPHQPHPPYPLIRQWPALALVSLASAATHAAEGPATTVAGAQAPISQVVLYPGIAAVERTARISAGARQLTFDCLPAATDVQSLQVTADAQVRIGDYKTLLQPRDVASKACVSPLDTQIRTLEDQLAALQADESAAGLVEGYLQGLAKPGSEGTKVPAPSQIGATSDALRTTSRDNALRAHQLKRQKELLEEQLKPLRMERDRTGAQRAQVMRVTVQLATQAHKVPTVPGALGLRPEPNPSATRCSGCCSIKDQLARRGAATSGRFGGAAGAVVADGKSLIAPS